MNNSKIDRVDTTKRLIPFRATIRTKELNCHGVIESINASWRTAANAAPRVFRRREVKEQDLTAMRCS